MASFPYKDSAVILLHSKYIGISLLLSIFYPHPLCTKEKVLTTLGICKVRSAIYLASSIRKNIYLTIRLQTHWNTQYSKYVSSVCNNLQYQSFYNGTHIHIYVYIYCIKNQHYTKNDSHQNISMNIYNIQGLLIKH